MIRWSRFLMLFAAFITTFVMLAPDADARRMGGGRSFGKSSNSLFKRSPTTPPRQNAAANNNGAQGAAAAGGRSGMMGMVGGLAAGLGLAWLASSLGLGEEFANMLMIILLVMAGMFLLRFILSRMGGARQAQGLRPVAAGNAPGGSFQREAMPAGSSPAPVSSLSGAATPPAESVAPADFDAETFLREAKVQFIRLQAVYDAADLEDLASFTTPEVFAELKMDINERGSTPNQTDVVSLEAELLGIDDTGPDYFASVHFSGLIRESADGVAEPFSEIWVLSKPRAGGSGWVLAGIEQNDQSAS